MKSLLLRVHSAKMSHDPANVNIHVYKRAKEAIEEELSRIIVKLHNYQGVNPLHRIAAYSQLSSEIMTELESTVFNEDNNLIYDIKSENRLRQIESSRTHSMLTQELAVKVTHSLTHYSFLFMSIHSLTYSTFRSKQFSH